MPHAALIAGRLAISNNGNKTIIDADGGLVVVRCTPQLLDLDAVPGAHVRHREVQDAQRR